MASKKLIKQHNSLTTARYDMSAMEKNIMYMLLQQINPKDQIQSKYEFRVKDIEEIRKVRIRKEEIIQAGENLIRKSLVIYNNDSKEFLTVGVLSNVKYKPGILIVEFDKSLHPLLNDYKKNYTTFSLEVALQLKHKYSKRLYEMLSQFKDTGVFMIRLDEFKKRLNLINQTTGNYVYKEFGSLRKEVLDKSQKEIDKISDISFTYVAEKTKNKYTHLKFYITRKNNFFKKTMTPDQILISKNKEGNEKKHIFKGKLEGESLKLYLFLTKDNNWLDNNLAYKVASFNKSEKVWNKIESIKNTLMNGEKINIRETFKEFLEE